MSIFIISEYVHQLLSNKLGAALLVHPSKGHLHPFDQVKINICGYADMWGVYSDSIVCQVLYTIHSVVIDPK
jgi:hypothetical protein